MAWAQQNNSTHGSDGGHGESGGHGSNSAQAAMFAAFKVRLAVNKHHARLYAAAICGLIAIFIVFHWTRYLAVRARRHSKSAALATITKPLAAISRVVRTILVRKLPGFKSNGHALLVTAYVAINASLTFTNVDMSNYSNIANRFGWMLSLNFALVVFLALKNTPLAFLTAYSYERLNGLHQISGYLTIVYLVLHAVTYTCYFTSINKWSMLREDRQIAGYVAGFGFLGIFVSAAIVRRFWYEAFYITHIMSFIVTIICAGFHNPELAKGIVIIMIVIASMWVADRLLRALRVAFYGINNSATIYPLPNGGTRIVLAKRPLSVVPGKHCFLWIPRIRALEMHPFTVVATAPMEFIVNSYDGFTHDLHKYAKKHPGARLTASIDGPYGTFPDPKEYDKVVLIAGGSGASFTFGLACNLLERMGAEAVQRIVFIWAVRKHDNLTWFNDHLATLRNHTHSPKVAVSLFVTRGPAELATAEQRRGSVIIGPSMHRANSASSHASSAPVSPSTAAAERDIEKALEAGLTLSLPARRPLIEKSDLPGGTGGGGGGVEDEKAVLSASRSASTQPSSETLAPLRGHAVTAGRPDPATLIREAVASTPAGQRVLIAACGPDSLMQVVREAAARCIRVDGPGVELHCEQFGW